MGYRIFLGKISKKKINKIKNVSSKNELIKKIGSTFDGDDTISTNNDISELTLHEFGKYINWTDSFKKNMTSPVFKNKKFNKNFTKEHELFILKKQGLIHIIGIFEEDLKSYYNEMKRLSELLFILTAKKELPEFGKLYSDIYTDLREKSDLCIYNDWLKNILSNFLVKDFFKQENSLLVKETANNLSSLITTYFRKNYDEYSAPFGLHFYNVNENVKHKITNSWYKDKSILELVHILKTFDFKNEELIIYGY